MSCQQLSSVIEKLTAVYELLNQPHKAGRLRAQNTAARSHPRKGSASDLNGTGATQREESDPLTTLELFGSADDAADGEAARRAEPPRHINVRPNPPASRVMAAVWIGSH